jgi:2-methylcitrate dehydratase PrpD
VRKQVDIDCIQRIEVYTYQLAVKGHNHNGTAGIASAKLSIPYSVAAALVSGKADVSVYEEKYMNRKIVLSLAQKVLVFEEKGFTLESPERRIARVDIYMDNGDCISARVDYAKGEPENPMERDEIIGKARSLLGGSASEIVNRLYKGC